MVVAYRLAPFTYWLAKRLVKLNYYSLPNQLLSQPLVPEFIQDDIVPNTVGDKLLGYLDDQQSYRSVITEFEKIHLLLKKDASQQAAAAVMKLLK